MINFEPELEICDKWQIWKIKENDRKNIAIKYKFITYQLSKILLPIMYVVQYFENAKKITIN